eukprot:COSAG02_NODE_7194_length_3126_cov_6.047572_4_plen_102_part_00
MGIEGYTRWLHEQYSDCFTAAPPSKRWSFDHVYLDLNGHFHYWAYQGAKNEEHLTRLVYLLRSRSPCTLPYHEILQSSDTQSCSSVQVQGCGPHPQATAAA